MQFILVWSNMLVLHLTVPEFVVFEIQRTLYSVKHNLLTMLRVEFRRFTTRSIKNINRLKHYVTYIYIIRFKKTGKLLLIKNTMNKLNSKAKNYTKTSHWCINHVYLHCRHKILYFICLLTVHLWSEVTCLLSMFWP